LRQASELQQKPKSPKATGQVFSPIFLVGFQAKKLQIIFSSLTNDAGHLDGSQSGSATAPCCVTGTAAPVLLVTLLCPGSHTVSATFNNPAQCFFDVALHAWQGAYRKRMMPLLRCHCAEQ
jgi:hypothetical protein